MKYSKLLFFILAIFIIAGIYYFTNPVKPTNMQKAPQDHEVPKPVRGTKNSEMIISEKNYDVNSVDLNYYSDVTGYYSQPSSEGDFPGVIMIHEWWGLNDHIKEMADKLAEQGYRVLAVDLFGTVAETPDQARTQVTQFDQQKGLQNLKAAYDYLKTSEDTKIASLGWCFGGAQSLRTALNNDIDASVIYYGNLVTETEQLSSLNAPVLGIFGREDTSIPVESVNDFKSALNEIGIQNDINIYDGVGHAFANPSGNNYSEVETIDAWNKTLNFLETNLK